MTLYAFVVAFFVIALIVFLVNIAPWVPANWKRIANWVGGFILVIILLNALGVIQMLKSIVIPSVR